jgi:hypothetical protein
LGNLLRIVVYILLENWFLDQTEEPPVLASNPQVQEAFGIIITGGSLVVERSKNRPPLVRFGAATLGYRSGTYG